MRVLVTGTSGYIGTMLGPYLMDRGHEVVGLDTGFYREGWLYNGTRDNGARGNLDRFPTTINKDIRRVTAADLEGFDAVAHLAELSNDPLGQLNPTITYKINHEGSVHLAKLCKRVGIERFVYTSSCSRSTVWARTIGRRRSPSQTRRRPTPNAKLWSSAMWLSWPTTASRPPSCATQRPTAPRRACASTSCSTISLA